MLRADLVHVGGDTWLDVLTWSRRDGEKLLMERANELVVAAELHSLMVDAAPSEIGEIVHSTQRGAA